MFGLRALKSINIYIEDHVSQQHVCLHVSLPGCCLFLAEDLTVPVVDVVPLQSLDVFVGLWPFLFEPDA